MKYLLIITVLISQFSGAITPDYAKEKRWAEQIEDGLMDGDIIKIKNNNKSFIAIWSETEKSSKKAAIILHGIGAHPDWADVILPLRTSLLDIDYNTLSIQLPVLANGTDSAKYGGLFIDADQRIDASINFLKKQGFEVFVLVAHSMGATMATHFLANNKHNITKFVGIGMNFGSLKYLPKVKIPILDLYGTNDLKIVLGSAKKRVLASSQNNKYIQLMIKGNHFFNNEEDKLISTVHNWLK